MKASKIKTKVPFAVSLMLIFGYSLFMALVPPSASNAEASALPTAQTPGSETPADQVIRAKTQTTTLGDAAQPVQ